ncbi:MAG: DUF5009 domain-containing protein [Candidatus Azobacteroides sp.]|nr:DUF5009 domain-containing protein [Candidatus Azobacteroides sp.]
MTSPVVIPSPRIVSIHIYKGILLCCLLIVKCMGYTIELPQWTGHAKWDPDIMGFIDVILPSFLFIIGMAVPYSIKSRLQEGQAYKTIFLHILFRSSSLVLMGVCLSVVLVSAENKIDSRYVWQVAGMMVGFFLLWAAPSGKKGITNILFRIGGALILCLLVWGKYTFTGSISLFPVGPLGIIGLTYFIVAAFYLFTFRRYILSVLWIVLLLIICITGINNSLGIFNNILPGNGSFPLLAMLGVLFALLYGKSNELISVKDKLFLSLAVALLFFFAGFLSHQFWITCKIRIVPCWLFYSAAFSILLYTFIYWLVEIRKQGSWFYYVEKVGMVPLTCYFVFLLVNTCFLFALSFLSGTSFMYSCEIIHCLFIPFLCICLTLLIKKAGTNIRI